ncbi:MAG TPA: MFS transporter [Gaiellaceae bacterium]|nr:MFS transporter [Gaiellaceae bacterium]
MTRVWGAWLVLMAGANLATPLYAVYADRFGFSSLVLTAVFATYAVVLVPALILFGRLSDAWGRRPVILTGLATAAVGLAVFLAAQNVAWLFVARGLQGLAVGMISGAATAALVELDPQADRRRAAMFAGLAQAGGSAAGPLVAGLLAQWAPDPLRLPYVVGLAATFVAAAVVLRIPDEGNADREPWRIQPPRVPRELLGPFLRVGLTAATVWAAVALYLSIVPSYAGSVIGSHNLAVLSAISALALAASFVTQLVLQRIRHGVRGSQAAGLVALAFGLVALALAAPLHSIVLLVAGALLAGVGHGFGFLNAQQELNELAPDERRGEVTAAFIACIYFLVASSVIATGVLDVWFSLTVAVTAVVLVLAATAVTSASWQLRTPRRGRSSAAGARAAHSR